MIKSPVADDALEGVVGIEIELEEVLFDRWLVELVELDVEPEVPGDVWEPEAVTVTVGPGIVITDMVFSSGGALLKAWEMEMLSC